VLATEIIRYWWC